MIEIEKNIKRIKSKRLIECHTLGDCIDLLNIYSEYLCFVGQYESIKGEKHIRLYEANLVNQMIFSKTLSLQKILEGINFKSKIGILLQDFIDPTIVATLIRNLFETILMFNLVYIQPKNEEERLIIYNLWVYSGLSYRQKFEEYATTEENIKKMRQEKENMQHIKEQIESTSYYKGLTERNKTIIHKELLQRKEYKIAFENGNIKKLTWRDVCLYAGFRPDLFEHVYSYFSLYAHPSNVSVFQFQDLFKNSTSIEITVHNLKNAFCLLSVFIADYIILFPDRKQVFEALPIEWQIVIDFNNTLARDNKFSINNCWDKLK